MLETGISSEVLAAPHHPYTKALLGALVENGMRETPALRTETGCCPFYRRCPSARTSDDAVPKCRREKPTRQRMVVLRGMISIQNIEKSFRRKSRACKTFLLIFPTVKICGVFGKSGIGKSTLAKVLCGVCPPDAGAVHAGWADVLFRQTMPYDRRLGISHSNGLPAALRHIRPTLRKSAAGFTELIRYHRFPSERRRACH